MKNVVLLSVAVAVLVFSGCSSKEPTVDGSAQAPVVSGESSKSSMASESSEGRIAGIEKKLSTIYFDFDKFNIRPDQQSNLSSDASVIKTEASDLTIKLEGNCDEWGSDEYNFALGLKRATTVKDALIASGADASKVTMVSYGESNAVCTEKTKDCWAKNRRVDFKVLP
ncbi:MAG: OmpA family protein [Campylobacterales bacterium]|nr:OmpA family protein [Campylobacterales bacterium]